jgi:hypothetical protein
MSYPVRRLEAQQREKLYGTDRTVPVPMLDCWNAPRPPSDNPEFGTFGTYMGRGYRGGETCATGKLSRQLRYVKRFRIVKCSDYAYDCL